MENYFQGSATSLDPQQSEGDKLRAAVGVNKALLLIYRVSETNKNGSSFLRLQLPSWLHASISWSHCSLNQCFHFAQ